MTDKWAPKETVCSSYRDGERVCKDGFFQRPGCRQGYANTPHKYVPYCLWDELPEHWIKEDGNLIFYRDKAND